MTGGAPSALRCRRPVNSDRKAVTRPRLRVQAAIPLPGWRGTTAASTSDRSKRCVGAPVRAAIAWTRANGRPVESLHPGRSPVPAMHRPPAVCDRWCAGRRFALQRCWEAGPRLSRSDGSVRWSSSGHATDLPSERSLARGSGPGAFAGRPVDAVGRVRPRAARRHRRAGAPGDPVTGDGRHPPPVPSDPSPEARTAARRTVSRLFSYRPLVPARLRGPAPADARDQPCG